MRKFGLGLLVGVLLSSVSAIAAIQLSIPIRGPSTLDAQGMPVLGKDSRVASLIHRVKFVGINFAPNGTVVDASVSVDSFVDNTAELPITTDTIPITLTVAQKNAVLATAYARVKLAVKFVGAVDIGDPP